METNDQGQVVVPCRECRCPGAPGHLTDDVYLLPEPTLRMGVACRVAISQSVIPAGPDGPAHFDDEGSTQRFMEIFIREGVAGWNLTLEDGSPKPLDKAALLADFELAMPTADAASDLYMVKVQTPLVRRLLGTSPTGSTASSSSGRNGQMKKRRGSSSRATTAASLPSTP